MAEAVKNAGASFEAIKQTGARRCRGLGMAADAPAHGAGGAPGIALGLGLPVRRVHRGRRRGPGRPARGGRRVLLADQHPSGRRHARRRSQGGLPPPRDRPGRQPGARVSGRRPPGAGRFRSRSAGGRSALHAAFARMSLGTAFGQDMDSRELRSEEEYWRTVGTKTPPLFGAAFRMGALLGGAPEPTVEAPHAFGGARPVRPGQRRSVGCPGDPGQGRLGPPAEQPPDPLCHDGGAPGPGAVPGAVARSAEPEALAEAQQILLRSGAVSYCVFEMPYRA